MFLSKINFWNITSIYTVSYFFFPGKTNFKMSNIDLNILKIYPGCLQVY